jgi:hypothetical protein
MILPGPLLAVLLRVTPPVIPPVSPPLNPPLNPMLPRSQASPAAPEEDRVALPGSVPARLASARMLGPVPGPAPMERMILVLKRTAAAQADLDRCLDDLQAPDSLNFHQWLTPARFGERFGLDRAALARVTGWLETCGFRVEEVAAGRMAITFSGTVAQVERAFRTAIRRYELDGRTRQGNAIEASIPRALDGLVAGVVGLNDLPRKAWNRGFSPLPADSGSRSMVPGDFAAIYNLTPLYQEGLDGTGVTIAIVGRTHIPFGDVARFRSTFGLPPREPEVILNGPDPGDTGEDGEADLDVEWAGAVAPNATIRFVVSGSTATTDGVDLSAQYIVDHDLAAVMSTSFGQCEPWMGSAELAFYKNLWAQAAAQGITAVVASGDSGPAGCDSGSSGSGSGAAVSGLASTPYNVAVGGTRFNEGSGAYWRARKARDGSSAMGYIPEEAWNESGAVPGGSGLWASGGGLSSIYPKPAWQAAEGVPADSYRCLPDVALTAAAHDGYTLLSGGRWQVTSGTSCSCPAFAGVLALVVQKAGRQGNANTTLYPLGRAQYQGTGPCVFHDITTGDTTVPGTLGFPCTPGYDLATGLGSVDAQALVGAWTTRQANNVDAVIQRPAADRTVASGTCVPFLALARTSQPGAGLTCLWDFGDGSTAQGTACHHTYRNPGPAPLADLVTFTATDGSGARGADTRTITVLPPPPPGELIRNGGFELGKAGWTARGVSIDDNRPAAPAHQGSADAWFPGRLPIGLLQQTVRIPAQAVSARLTFWLQASTRETSPLALDTFSVKARGGNGVLAILGSWSNLAAGPTYQQHSLDLGAYRGQRVQLSFVASAYPKGLGTSFALDDVSLIAK